MGDNDLTRVDNLDSADALSTITKTTCPYCGVGCGIQVTASQGSVMVKGDDEHPANRGKLCVKGTSVAETLSLDGRLLAPMVNGQVVSVESAIDAVAEGLQQTIATYGPEAVAFYVSGQLLTEDYYVANKLIKGFIGTANIDTNSRLCMASAVVGYKRAFGSDTVPASYADLAEADLLVLVGSNAAWAHPILFQQMSQSKKLKPNKKVVLIDPRATDTADIADLHLPLKPGSDAMLFNGLLTYLAESGSLNHAYIAAYTEGFEAAVAASQVNAPSIEVVASYCGLSVEAVATFYAWFAQTDKTVTFYSQGVNQSSSGVDKSNAIINVHLATGRVGKLGASPFSITGQPNAMGGREVGGLANQLAAHMDFSDAASVDRVATFWQATNMARANGLKAVDMFRAVDEGKIKAIWIMHTNPVVSMPDADFVAAALEKCPLVIVSDNMAETDTVNRAHIRLPAAAWGEKSGTVTNSARCISRQRAFLPMPGQAKEDWWWISRVAQKMGFSSAFDYRSPADIFREHARLSGYENDGVLSRRDFDISALQALPDVAYDEMPPVFWPVNAAHPTGKERMLEDGQFFTKHRKANFIAIQPQLPREMPCAAYPFVFNTGRYRDQWHTMTRTAMTPRLLQHRSEPLLSMHPEDMQQLGIQVGDIVQVRSRVGEALLRASIDKGMQPGQVFAPMHWTSVYAAKARVDALVPAHADPLSGQPESKHAVVSVKPWAAKWYGWMITRDAQWQPATGYWIKVPLAGATLWHLADDQALYVEQVIPSHNIRYVDQHAGVQRFALVEKGHLQRVLFTASQMGDMLPSPDWVSSLFTSEPLTDVQRFALLSGKDANMVDEGATVCACYQVGEKTIQTAILQGAHTVEAIGACCRAGTNCGSCIPEIKRLLAK